jgi:acetyl-CoA carboxylase carboxyl transferase subunit alpha
MLENAVYSVITPEGCAAILWKDAAQSSRAAECLRLTADDLQKFGLIDEIIPEPYEWKYNPNGKEKEADKQMEFDQVSQNLKASLLSQLEKLNKFSVQERINLRYQRFRKMGSFEIP